VTISSTIRGDVRLIMLWVVVAILAACGSPNSDPKLNPDQPLDIGPKSAPGLICGILDRHDVARLTGVDVTELHEWSSSITYPTAGKEFSTLECTVMNERKPRRDLLGIVVDQDSFEQDIRRLQQVIDPAPGAVTAPPALGKGAAAPGIGGYVVRRCPNGTNYILRTSTQEKFGTAQQWLALIEGGIRRADAAGACQRKPTLLPAPTSGRPSSG
jgi:hypothetical protein